MSAKGHHAMVESSIAIDYNPGRLKLKCAISLVMEIPMRMFPTAIRWLSSCLLYLLCGIGYSMIVNNDPIDFAHLNITNNLPLFQVEKSAPFSFDGTKPYEFVLGRGSGREGLETSRIKSDGTSKVSRKGIKGWQETSVSLTAAESKLILDAFEAEKIVKLEKAYHADTSGGTQWVLVIKSDGKYKAVYFNNHFPEPIIRFAKTIDSVISKKGTRMVDWKNLDDKTADSEQKEIWSRINDR